MTQEQTLIQIVKKVLGEDRGTVPGDRPDWQSIVDLAKKHGLLAFVYLYAGNIDVSEQPGQEIMSALEKSYAAEVMVNVLQQNAITEMRSAFEAAGIDNMFIKGAVTKGRYKNELLRSMGDIDFLYKPEQDALLKKAMGEIGFRFGSNGRVHDSYRKGTYLNAEAHRQLISPSSPYEAFGRNIWERSEPVSAPGHCRRMTIEDEIIFNVIHFASHFKKGGAGVRFVIDVWVYSRYDADWDHIYAELKKLQLFDFYQNALSLAGKWFGGGERSDITDAMEEYVLTGGVFGSARNRTDAVIAKGKLNYFRRSVFPPFKDMQSMYPWLKHKIALPFAWAARGVKSLTCRRKNVKILLAPVSAGDEQNALKLMEFYKECGL